MAVALFSACSNDDVTLAESTSGFSSTGDGYVGVSIKLPSTKSTRANDVFADGEASEYTITCGSLSIFVGGSEESATFVGTYDLDIQNWDLDTDADNVTTYANKTVKVGTSEISKALKNNTSGQMYGLVQLNYSAKVSETDEFSYSTPVNYIDDDLWTASNGQAVGSLGLPMWNAVLTDASGKVGSGNAYQLVPLGSTVYSTESEAAANPAGTIAVERAVAKVSLDATKKSDSVELAGASVAYTIDNWRLTNTQAYSNLYRNPDMTNYYGSEENLLTLTANSNEDGATTYRVAGTTALDGCENNWSENTIDGNSVYRTYFAETYNYFQSGSVTRGLQAVSAEEITNKLGSYEYCNENMFPVDLQMVTNTTLAVVKANLQVDGSNNFYIIDGEKSTIYTTEALQTKLAEDFKSMFDELLNSGDMATVLIGGDILYMMAIINECEFTDFDVAVEFDASAGDNFEITQIDLSYTYRMATSSGYLNNQYYYCDTDDDGKAYGITYFTLTRNSEDSSTWDFEGATVLEGQNEDIVALQSYFNVLAGGNELYGYAALQPKGGQKAAIGFASDFANRWEISTDYDYDNQIITTTASDDLAHTVSCYEGGDTYYYVKIKHFGDDDTPWTNQDSDAQASGDAYGLGKEYDSTGDFIIKSYTNDAYKLGEAKYLGRYGVLRNNWYDITVTAITGLGEPMPIVPNTVAPSKEDDEMEEYIAVEIQVLSWAKRTQTTTLN